MKIKIGGLLISVLLLTACTPTNQLYWQESRSAAHLANMGIRHANKGKYQQAIPFYHKALEIDPNLIVAREQLALAHYNIGKEYLDWKRYARAGSEFKIALGIDPHLKKAQQGLKSATRQLQLSALE